MARLGLRAACDDTPRNPDLLEGWALALIAMSALFWLR